jgi:hypothetical protein
MLSEEKKNMLDKWIKTLLFPEAEKHWQRKIDDRFVLVFDTDANTFFLYDNHELSCQFTWADILEIQVLRRSEFPPLSWKIIADHCEWLIPIGGRYAELLEEKINHLPNYSRQQNVELPPPSGYRTATSQWRRNNTLPFRPDVDWEDIGYL